VKVDFDKQTEVYETNLDYTSERGWHLGVGRDREPRFEKPAAEPRPTEPARHLPLLVSGADVPRVAGCTCGWRTPRDAHDSDTAFAEHVAIAKLTPDINWESVGRMEDLRRVLEQKAVAWVLEDRLCEDLSVALTRVEDEVDALRVQDQEPRPELRAKLERMDVDFKLASQRTERRDEEFRQAARKLVAELERVPRATAQAFVDALKEGPEAAREFVEALKKES
jgi:hypothetical protein